MARLDNLAQVIPAETETSHLTGTSKPTSRLGGEREAAGKQALPPRTRRDRLVAEDRAFRVLVDPQNDDLSEHERASLARMSTRSFRRYRAQLTAQVVQLRRWRYAEELVKLDAALIEHARKGSYPHLMTAYERIEGWVPGGKDGQSSTVDPSAWDAVGPEVRQQIGKALSRTTSARALRPGCP